jgi:hypothetical protein
MKKISFLVILAVVLGIAGCGYYSIIKESKKTADLRNFNVVSVGWLDLGEGKWKYYGYEDKDKGKWGAVIMEMNLKKLPQYLKDYMPKKTINTVRSIGEAPKNEGVIVTFSDVNYAMRTSTGAQIMFGGFAGSDTLDLTVHFRDAKTGAELYSSTVSIVSQAGSGYSSWAFEGRLNNTVYNLARYISEHCY